MWQVLHDRLPTNSLRASWGVSENKHCPFECGSEETLLHILRDCEIARNIWKELINPNFSTAFFSVPLQVWLNYNGRNNPGGSLATRWPWKKVFGMICWTLWKHRCRKVFDNKQDPPETLLQKCLHCLHEELLDGKYSHIISATPTRNQTRWQPPLDDYIRLDVDAAYNQDKVAASGGILRDQSGSWRCGFQQRFGVLLCNTEAEFMAIRIGLQVCKDRGFRKIKLFSDSIEALHLLGSESQPNHPLGPLIQETKSLIYSDWDLQLNHAYRECLACADSLAKDAINSSTDLIILDAAPTFCLEQMSADMR